MEVKFKGKGVRAFREKRIIFFFSSAAQELAVCCVTWIQGPSPLLPQVVTGAAPLVTWYRGRDPVRPREEAQPGSQPSDGNNKENAKKISRVSQEAWGLRSKATTEQCHVFGKSRKAQKGRTARRP